MAVWSLYSLYRVARMFDKLEQIYTGQRYEHLVRPPPRTKR
jgi:hypothetical protein